MSDYKKAKITVSFVVDLNMNVYPEGATLQDAVAFDIEQLGDMEELLNIYLSLSDSEYPIAVINVEDAPVEKNEVALLAERMSKEL